MSITTTYAYDTPGNFTYDPAKIDVSGGKAQLKLVPNPGIAFSQAFASDAGFTYDPDAAEFVGGVLRQKRQRPSGATFGARWDSQVDASWSDGLGVATVFGGAAISGGKLDLTGGSGKYVTFDAADNVSQLDLVGTARFRFTTNYNGIPANAQVFLTINSGSENKIQLFHHNNGAFFLLMNDLSGQNQISSSVSPFSATAGQEIELELSWDLNAGKVRFFGMGFLVVEMDVNFGRDGNLIDTIQIGDANSDFLVRDLVFFNDVQHTANYTAGEYSLPVADYVACEVVPPAFAYSGPGALQAFSAAVFVDAGAPRYTFNGKYWNGSAWATSSADYATANPAATSAAHIAALALSGTTVIARAYFTAGNARSSIDTLTLTVTGQIYPTDDPAIFPISSVAMDSLRGFVAVVDAAGSDGVRFHLKVGGTPKYWNGSAWATSNGSYAQSNPAATVATNEAALDLSLGAIIIPVAVLHSADGSTTPDIVSLTIVSNFFAPAPTAPAVCSVWGYIVDAAGVAIEGATLEISVPAYFKNGGYMVPASKVTVTSNSEGYFDINLEETTTANTKLKFKLTVPGGQAKTIGEALIPTSANANLATLLAA